MKLAFRDGFDWKRVTWSGPNSPPPSICSYCFGALPEVPLALYRENGAGASFCDACVETWVISEVKP